VGAELGTTFNDVLAPQDVATYGALCSLASFSRPEMKTRIIDNIAFREFLELMPEVRTGTVQLRPQHPSLTISHAANITSSCSMQRDSASQSVQVREMVHAFYASSYATCLQQLEALRPQLALDMHLAVGRRPTLTTEAHWSAVCRFPACMSLAGAVRLL
jgi:COP9 signalosome complex subunit 1